MKNLLLIVVLFLSVQLSAQKITLESGSIKALKGVSSLDVKFVYADDMHVGKLTEAEYIEKHMKEAEEREKGTGEKWKEMYYADREEHFAPKFLALFNDVLKKTGMDARENNNDAKIQMIVTTTFLEPGFNVGISSRPAYINLEITFINMETNEEIAKYILKKSPGTAYYDFGVRVGEAYAKAAKSFAKLLAKKKAF
ncbi:MAG: hypothetical protein DRI84_00690 [Bacteroidetes bacterium]|nr:MAG: hypothetical protein DRI84_00690 [Bacteroidota bacterium]